MKFHGLDWQQSTKMDFQSKSNPKKDWIFRFFQIHNPILPTSAKTADLYKEIKLSDECCPLPTTQAFRAMVENSGAKMKKIECNYKCRDLVCIDVKECGDVIEEIHVKNKAVYSPLEVPARMLEDISQLNPKALITLKLKSITCTLNRTRSGPKIPAAGHSEGEIFWDLWLN